MQKKSVYFLVAAIGVLIVIGCVMLFSTSAFAQDSRGNPYFFIKRQSTWLAVGIFAAVVAANLDYHFWRRACWWLFGVALVLLVLCFVPYIGLCIKGSHTLA